MSLSLLRARRRVEDHLNRFGFGRNKNKHSSLEDSLDQSRRNSDEFEQTEQQRGLLIEKERKLVNTELVKCGMLRFRFLLEACPPGCVPDPQLLAAALDLQAPVVARAALYLECCNFVHKCTKGQWPTWMKLNLPMFRPSGPLANRGMPSGHQRTHLLQKAAGKMFYQWAEAIGSRLEELLIQNPVDFANELALANLDDSRRKQLRLEDEEEDFLDEASVNSSGNSCPFALKLVACQLLLEITTFLRDYFQDIPRSSRLNVRDRPSWEPRSANISMGSGFPGPRRWSMAIGVMGISQHSLASLTEPPVSVPIGERKISFVLQPTSEQHGDLESIHSSNTTLAVQGDGDNTSDEKKPRRLAQGRAHLLRKNQGFSHSSSFKRRSIKLRKSGRKSIRDDDDDGKSTESMRSRRKVSIVSDRSDTSEHGAEVSGGEESPVLLSDDHDQPADSPCDFVDDDESHYVRDMSWLKLVNHIYNSMSFICPHQHFCQPSCYRRQMRASSRLVKANPEATPNEIRENEKQEKKDRKYKKNLPGMGSPLRRNLSIARNLDKLESDVCKVNRSHMSSMTHLATGNITYCLKYLYLYSKIDKIYYFSAILHSDASQVNLLATHQQKPDKVKKKDDSPVVQYIKTQVSNLCHSPFSMLIKGAADASEDIFIEAIPVAWELLLESDQQLSATAAVVFILSAVKAPEQAVSMMHQELKHENPKQRSLAVLRFHALWRYRFQAWPRMEDCANSTFKVPPPGIDFTLPSPKLGLDNLPVIDPPWMPQFKTKVEEVTLNQDQSLQRSFVTATKTRRKQKIEIIHNALFAEEEKHRAERENFLMTSFPVYLQAAYEPSLYHAAEADHEEVDEEAASERTANHHIQMAQSLFPSCLCSAVVPIINLLDDAQVTNDGVAVYEAASKVIWSCMVEDPSLFFRHFLEKITREKQDEMFQILRRLLRFFPKLPSNAAFVLYNYMVGYVMFYMRTPSESSQDLIGNAISLLWQITPSVQGLTFKDLKQTLRKEQCDTTLLLTANVPSAKKVVVHGTDANGIPSQYPVLEDTQFSSILQESFEFFGVDEKEHQDHALVDFKTRQMHNLNSFVRDFYYFKRSQYPQLHMIKISAENAFKQLQKESLSLQFIEIGKIPQRVFFLHEELMKLPSFPRRALESDFTLFHGDLGKELLCVNVMHKVMWVQLVAKMFEALSGSFAHSSDIHLFLNVVNGSLMLHCEDSAMLRLCLATFIDAAHQFKNIFASNGYFLIMPTLLRIYASHQTNIMVCTAIEFAFKQFYIMHRKPFILQLFGSIACMLDMDIESRIGDANKMQPECFFKLLLSFGMHITDPLDILSLVHINTPLKPLDFCYNSDPDYFTVLDAISLCVTVVAFAADSYRSHQMLLILEAILPFYLKHMRIDADRIDSSSSIRTELQMFQSLSACMKALINNCEALARNYTGPQRTVDVRGSSTKTNRGLYSPAVDIDDDSHSKLTHYQYPNSRRSQYDKDMDDSEVLHAEFRRPRETLLSVIAEFFTKGTARCQELQAKTPDQKLIELLDNKCHLRMAEVAHSLLKMSPYDPITMSCKGLKKYMMEFLPATDWTFEGIRPALIMILRRLEKTFNKIAKKPEIRVLISVCQSIVLGDQQSLGMTMQDAILTTITPVSGDVSQFQHPPENFCMIVIKIITLQMSALKSQDSQSLEQLCGGNSVFPSSEKTEVMLMNLILPMCQKIGSEFKDIPKLRPSDIIFALTSLLHAINPPSKITNIGQTNKNLETNAAQGDKSLPRIRPTIYIISFLGIYDCQSRLGIGVLPFPFGSSRVRVPDPRSC
ncbi:Protein unc-80 [Nymphon striatum]|nr:Protein unc-80 [Nymphon striatum]